MNAYTPPPSSEEKLHVLIVKGVLHDDARNRDVPYKLYFPTGVDEKVPVIIWSHGLGGSRDGAGFIARFVASHGYVVLNIQHAGTDSSLWEGKPGHPWDNIRKANIPRQASLDRFADVPFVLDHLNDIAAAHAEAGAVMDMDVIAMSGHSFGSLTTQVMAGQLFPRDGKGDLASMKEARFRAGILYSPVPIPHLTDADPAVLYGPIALPLFHMTGTDDASPVEKFGFAERLAVFENSKAERHLLVLKDGDHMVYNGSRGQLEENPKRRVHEDIIKVASVVYWDAYLKGDRAAFAWLMEGGFSAWLGDEGTYQYAS
jgi:dienelactone hydrolase